MRDASPEMLSLFCGALERPSAQDRAAYLDAACGKDSELRARVEALLRAHEQAGGFLRENSEGRDPGATIAEPVSGRPGGAIGPCRLLEEIGEGGMGVVWMAEQTEPVRRRVALKVIKPGLGSGQVVARFEQERQALAVMDHPNIAKVLDGGETEEGRPYFVMELVKGLPITRYCDERRLAVRERLGLFVSVCQAVQHAHQKGVIHRDLKPSNVLVALYDGVPVPKVIDFGVAKATAQKLTERTLFTGFGAVVGTPEYMSPEQAELNQLDIDTRSDVYSLGVLLYELLTGTTPLEHPRVKGADLLEVLRRVREEEPPTPSARLGTTAELAAIAARRGAEPKKLSWLLRGELDCVVMRCLEKDRNRRYQAAGDLAADLGRYLADAPVLACPPSAAYLCRKFARRHRRALATLALLGVTLLAAVGGVAGSFGWAARDRAARRAALGQEVSRALQDVEALYARDKLTDALAEVKRAEGVLASGAEDADLGWRVRRWRADLETAARLAEIRLEQAAVKAEDYDWAGADRAYGQAFRDHGLDVEALDVDEAAARIRDTAIRDRLVAALDDWALARQKEGAPGWQDLLTVARRADPDPWRDRLREALGRKDRKALAELAAGPEVLALPPATVQLLGEMLRHTGQRPLAEEIYRRALWRHPGDFWINHNLALALTNRGAAAEAEAVGFFRVALALRPDSPGVYINLGSALWRRRKLAEAEAAFREALRLKPDFGKGYEGLSWLFAEQKRLAAWEAESRATLRLRPDDGPARLSLGFALHRQSRFKEAAEEFGEALRRGPSAAAREALADVRMIVIWQDRDASLAEKEAAYREALRLNPDLAAAHYYLGAILRQRKRAEAEFEFREAVRLQPRFLPARYSLASMLVLQNKTAEAEAAYREILRIKPDHPQAFHGLVESQLVPC
jgi:tetratricopeptide (TPR) repeat protein